MKKTIMLTLTLLLLNLVQAHTYQVLGNGLLLVEGELDTSLLEKQEDTWSLYVPYHEKGDEVYFPNHAVLTKVNTQREYGIAYDKGIVIWFMNNTQTLTEIQYQLKPKQENAFKTILYIFPIFLIITVLQYKYHKKNEYKKLLKKLNENEKKIVTTLIENDKELTQNELRKETKMAKSTLSRTLKNLENKEIIITKEHGITKKIKLK